jgi:hypothetical protein
MPVVGQAEQAFLAALSKVTVDELTRKAGSA